jgi:hypothetical protein
MEKAVCSRVVAKMQCHESPEPGTYADNNEDAKKVRLGAVYEAFKSEEERAASENAIFGKYTPWGECVMGITNPVALAFFKPGKKYYVTFTEAPD